jgi:hypothetical protein
MSRAIQYTRPFDAEKRAHERQVLKSLLLLNAVLKRFLYPLPLRAQSGFR